MLSLPTDSPFLTPRDRSRLNALLRRRRRRRRRLIHVGPPRPLQSLFTEELSQAHDAVHGLVGGASGGASGVGMDGGHNVGNQPGRQRRMPVSGGKSGGGLLPSVICVNAAGKAGAKCGRLRGRHGKGARAPARSTKKLLPEVSRTGEGLARSLGDMPRNRWGGHTPARGGSTAGALRRRAGPPRGPYQTFPSRRPFTARARAVSPAGRRSPHRNFGRGRRLDKGCARPPALERSQATAKMARVGGG